MVLVCRSYYSSFRALQQEVEEALSPRIEMEMMSLLKAGYLGIKEMEIEPLSKVWKETPHISLPKEMASESTESTPSAPI